MDAFKRMFGGGAGAGSSKGSSKEAAQKKTENALQALRGNAEDCNAKLADLHRRMDEAQNEVKALMQKGQKEKAKLALRRKKMIEKQTMAVQNNSDRLQEQILQMEMSQNNILTVTALQQAATAGKANLKANDIEDVDLVLDEIAEQNDQMSQIQDALAQSTMQGVDEDDLEAELDELADMQIDEDFSAVPAAPQAQVATPDIAMPSAPTTAAVPTKTAEDLELEKLMEETGMTPAQ